MLARCTRHPHLVLLMLGALQPPAYATAHGMPDDAPRAPEARSPASAPTAAERVAPLPAELNDECAPEWLPTFGPREGVNGWVDAMIVFDDGSGSGPALYVAGSFTVAGSTPANRIARWDGQAWSPLGSGFDAQVLALAVFDDGSGAGPQLYAGGFFSTADGLPASRIARWDGSSWSPLGLGLSGGAVRALAVYDDGTGNGPKLFAGGSFNVINQQFISASMARWDGVAWSVVGPGAGSGMNGAVRALAVHDLGGGPRLYAGGDFTLTSGGPANGVAQWNGSSWSGLGAGVDGSVRALAAFGDALVVGGDFSAAGGDDAARVASWNGQTWSPLAAGVGGTVRAFAVETSGESSVLHVTGDFLSAGASPATRLATWNGSDWSPLGAGINSAGNALAFYAPTADTTQRLFVGGQFNASGAIGVRHLAVWDGTGLGVVGGLNAAVNALVRFDAGDGPALVAGGVFTNTGPSNTSYIARWTDGTWSSLGDGPNGVVAALAIYDDGLGAGSALYAAGNFSAVGGIAAGNIAKWDGAEWSPVGSGFNGVVNALLVAEQDGASVLVAGGSFTTAGGVPANRIAAWNGTAWSPVGSGFSGTVNALEMFDDGSGDGPALVAAGSFTAGGDGTALLRIAKRSGGAWHPVGGGMNGIVRALATHDDGGGIALYAGGTFTSAGAVSASRVAKWNGTAWSSLGSGVSSGVTALASFDDGDGDALFVGGSFTGAGALPARHLARWTGSTWQLAVPMGAPEFENSVLALLPVTTSDERSLYVGGAFATSPADDAFLARLAGCPTEVACGIADLDCDGLVDAADLALLLDAWGSCEDCAADLDGDGLVGAADLAILLGAWSEP